MKQLIPLAFASAMLAAMMPLSPALAHGCHAAPQFDQHGYHRHIRHCLRVALPRPR